MSHFNLTPKATNLIEAINKSGDIAEIVSSLDVSDLSEKEQAELDAALETIDRHLHILLGYAIA